MRNIITGAEHTERSSSKDGRTVTWKLFGRVSGTVTIQSAEMLTIIDLTTEKAFNLSNSGNFQCRKLHYAVRRRRQSLLKEPTWTITLKSLTEGSWKEIREMNEQDWREIFRSIAGNSRMFKTIEQLKMQFGG